MSFFRKNPFVTLGLLLLVLVGLPAAIFLSQNKAENRSHAAASVILSFTPSSSSSNPVSVAPGSTVSVDLMVDPGSNAVSYVQTELDYDPTKFRVDSGGFQVNTSAFPQTVQGPFYNSGKVSFAVSVGADGTKAIQSPAKVGTLTLTALPSSGTSQITFVNPQALSISSGATFRENVISSTVPAYLAVGDTTTVGPTQPPTSCSTNPSNTILAIDTSGSMSVASTANKITQAKTAAKSYVDIIAQDARNLIGLVSYANTATVNSPLTSNYSSVKNQIDSLTAIGSTCTECAILAANQQLAASPNGNKKVVVLLTDGLANYIQGGTQQVDTAVAEQRALAAAAAGHANGIVYYTIGLGQSINANFLQQIANTTGGKYYASPTADQLNTIYQQISQVAGLGSVTGAVFKDSNNNKIFDSTEQKLSGWTLQLFPQGSTTPQTFTSDANGFNITGLCNGTYTLKEVVQSGWRQTVPVNPPEYTINITNGNSVTDKNFGNTQGNTCADGIDNNGNNFIDSQDPICHTDGNKNNPNSYDPNLPERNGNTCADGLDNNNNNLIDGLDPVCHTGGDINNPYDPDLPEGSTGTGLSLTVLLHGIGASGDNANPTANSLSNKNPLHTTRKVQVFIYNTDNVLVASPSGEVTYASASGSFTGTVTTASPLSAGAYNIRVGAEKHLIRRLPGTPNIVSNTNNQLPPIHVVAGDINDDNHLNILDYNTLMDCYSDTLPAPSCSDQTKKTITDLNDDGVVNGTDYNLFLREIANQPGD